MIEIANCIIVKPDGERFSCSPYKLRSFLKKGMVVATSRDGVFATTELFNFKHEAYDVVGKNFYNGFTYKYCVVCGKEDGLTRHHVVPKKFTKHFIKQYRSNCHDLVLLCKCCHDRCNDLEIARHEKWLEPYYLSVSDALVTKQYKKVTERYLAQGDNAGEIDNIFGYLPCRAELEKIIDELRWKLNPSSAARAFVRSHRQSMAVIRKCRIYFVYDMRPQYLPDGWDIDYEIF